MATIKTIKGTVFGLVKVEIFKELEKSTLEQKEEI